MSQSATAWSTGLPEKSFNLIERGSDLFIFFPFVKFVCLLRPIDVHRSKRHHARRETLRWLFTRNNINIHGDLCVMQDGFVYLCEKKMLIILYKRC